jgi:NAD(P)H-dependent flavin oxidoreductase YrpB (nitropropane dioxygenase family)
VLGEVTTQAEAQRALAAGVSGLIVAGHEAGGWGGAESSFVLLQSVLRASDEQPVWVRGGIGPKVAAGCVAAGAAGVVLDGALLLARESPLNRHLRDRIARWDGSETVVPKLGARRGKRRSLAKWGGRPTSVCRSVKTRRSRVIWRAIS